MTSIATIKELNKQAGYYFFSKDTMKFFASKVESKLYKSGYFITSEKTGFSSYNREYKVRLAKKDEHGNFNGEIDNNPAKKTFHTKEEAKEWIKIFGA